MKLMIKIVFSFFLLLSFNTKSWAQEVELIDLSAKSDNNTVSVETQAEFPNFMGTLNLEINELLSNVRTLD